MEECEFRKFVLSTRTQIRILAVGDTGIVFNPEKLSLERRDPSVVLNYYKDDGNV